MIMASVLVPLRVPKMDVKTMNEMVKEGEATSRSDAARMLIEIGCRQRLREKTLQAIHETYGMLKGVKKGSLEMVREARNERWERLLKKAGGNKETALDLLIEEGNKESARLRKATLR